MSIGFCITAACTYVLVWQLFMVKQMETMTKQVTGESSAKELVLSDVEEQKHDGATSILGSVKNTGSQPARGFQIRANLFNHGKFVDQYSTYMSKIGPGESEHFKIACGCKDTPAAEHDSYKVEVLASY